jgi:hypothetical protein
MATRQQLEESSREQWGKLVQKLNTENIKLKFDLVSYKEKDLEYKKFKILMDAINKNPIAKSYWDSLVVVLRMQDM